MERKNGIVLLILGVILLIGCGMTYTYFYFQPSKEEVENKESNIKELKTEVIWKESLTTEVYSKVKVSDFVTIQNGKLVEDPEIDTTNLGKKLVFFTYANERGKKQESSFELTITDTTAPIVWVSQSYTYLKGTKKSLEELILCGDNYDKNPTCKVEGEYRLDQVGEYPVTFTAKDQSGNERREEFTLKVVEKVDSYIPNKISLEEAKTKYLTDDTTLGIDVSKWQGKIDWEKVKSSGVQFVMIRMGTQIGPGLESNLDRYFQENITEAKRVGIPVGVYYYSYASSVEEARKQAKWVTEILKSYTLDLPVVFDWECYSYFNTFHISLHDLNQIANTFLQEVEQEGYQGMHYGSKNYLQRLWTEINYPIWLAHYTEKTDYQKEYKIWQFTSNGTVPGIEGSVDIDVMKK